MLDHVRLLGWVAATIALAAVLAGCADQPEPTPDPSPSPTAPPTALDPGSVGSEGLDIRYLHSDGTIKVLKVKDFPR